MPDPAGREPRDIRASRPRLLSRGSLGRGLRRLLSVTTLVVLDIGGLALGLMLALTVRTLVYGDTLYWSILWSTGPANWLPFLAPVTVFVFYQAGLYSSRERRPGAGRIVRPSCWSRSSCSRSGSAPTISSRRRV